MNKHTPGPWLLYHEVFRPELCDKKIIEVQSVNGKSVVPWIGFDSADMSKSERLANAKLIAKAPEMHVVLEDFLSYWDFNMVCQNGLVDRCRCRKCIRERMEIATGRKRERERESKSRAGGGDSSR